MKSSARVVHVLTVHWRDDRWIDIQLGRLQALLRGPTQLYASLSGLSGRQRSKFDYAETEPDDSHAAKLNRLAAVACRRAASREDILLFLDGDAFPIAALDGYLARHLDRVPLLAVQRRENLGDPQPHPSFCATSVGFWSDIGGDWRAGYSWINDAGEPVTDVGGNLLAILERHGVDWHRVLRSNARELHPIWFGLYDDVVYHHGAGFRVPEARVDRARAEWRSDEPTLLVRRLWRWLPRSGRLGAFRRRLVSRYWKNPVVAESAKLSDQVYRSIKADTQFYRAFMEP